MRTGTLMGLVCTILCGSLLAAKPKQTSTIGIPFPSSTERKRLEEGYAKMTMEEQLEAVKKNPEVIRFQKMREAKANDPYRPIYHFSTPEGLLNDPNGFCYWNGNYHMFYQLQAAGTGTMQWGHAYSPDLVHWQDLPFAIRQEDGSGRIFSGQVLVEKDRTIAMFHDTSFGNCIALANDPLLLAFTKTGVNKHGSGKFAGKGFQRLFDPCIWKGKDGMYYSVSGVCKNGGRTKDGFPVADLFRSEDLKNWEYLGTLLNDDDWTRLGLGAGDDSAVPNFQPIAHRDGSPSGKHMYLWFSHGKGAHAMVGTYDEDNHHFSPESYHRMTFGPVYKGTLHAPSAMVDEKGRFLATFNIRENMQPVGPALNAKTPDIWYGIMSLARHFWLNDNKELCVEPAGNLESLRFNHQHIGEMELREDKETVLEQVKGNAIEIRAIIQPGDAETVGLKVLRSPDGNEYTTIQLHTKKDKDGFCKLELDVSQGSKRQGVPERSSEIGTLKLQDGENLDLRIFVDRSVIEVYANDRQSLTARVYPGGKQSQTVAIFSKGGKAKLISLDAWKMKTIGK